MPRLLAPAAQQHRVAVFQEAALLAVGQRHRALTSARQLDDRAGLALAWAGDRAAAEQVAGVQAAPAHGVVRHHLRDGPVLVPEAGR